MAAQQGFVYEVNAAKYLKPIGLVPKNFTPAGAGHDQPDLMLLYKDDKQGCELKITDASAGSLVLKYTPNQNPPWGFGDIKNEEKEKLFIRDLAKNVKLFDELAKAWNNRPYKVDKQYQDAYWKRTAGNLNNRERYARDHRVFRELKGEIPSRKIESYYNRKDTFYVNVGTHGFYMMGNRNPYRLKKVPRFSVSSKALWRARVQAKGGGNYQFTFEMGFRIVKKSQYNIAPVKSKSNVEIDKGAVDISCFPEL